MKATYKVIEFLGEGSFGKAYLAQCDSDNNKYVIKQISLEGMSDEEINSAIKKIMNREEYKDLPVGPLPALIDVCPQILIYNPDDERKPR